MRLSRNRVIESNKLLSWKILGFQPTHPLSPLCFSLNTFSFLESLSFREFALLHVFTCSFTVPSSIQLTQNETITEEGENVTVSCNASGTPPLVVAWIKVDSGKRFDGSELVLTHINRTQAGEYRCEASNECGIASETATIEVQCKYQFVALNHLYK